MSESTVQRRCKGCDKFFERGKMIKIGLNWYHSRQCAIDLALANVRKKALADTRRAEKALKSEQRKKKQLLKKRTGKNGYYANLKTALHYYVKHVLRIGEPCYTCDNPQTPNNCHHVGHFIPAKETDPRRFMLENLRIQCFGCNSHNSGKRLEYRERLIEEKGLEHVEWLECDVNHKNLNEQYPDIEDIKSEIARYRKLTRDFQKQNSIT